MHCKAFTTVIFLSDKRWAIKDFGLEFIMLFCVHCLRFLLSFQEIMLPMHMMVSHQLRSLAGKNTFVLLLQLKHMSYWVFPQYLAFHTCSKFFFSRSVLCMYKHLIYDYFAQWNLKWVLWKWNSSSNTSCESIRSESMRSFHNCQETLELILIWE